MKIVACTVVSPAITDMQANLICTVRSDPIHFRIACVAASLLVLIIGLSGAFAYQGWKNSSDQANINTLNIVNLLERQIYDSFARIDMALYAGAIEAERALDSEPSLSSTLVEDFFVRQQALLPEVIGYTATDANGMVRFGSRTPDDKTPNISDRDAFQTLKDNPEHNAVVFGPFIATTSKTWVIGIARALRDKSGKFLGVIFAMIPTEELQQKLQRINLGTAGAIALRTADMSLVARVTAANQTDTMDIGSRQVSAGLKSAIDTHPTEGSYLAKTAIDQIERVNAYKLISPYSLYVIVGLATQEANAEWRNQAILILMLGLLAIGATALGAHSIAKLRKTEYQNRLDDVQHTANILQEQKAQLKLAASVFTHAREGIIIADASGNILDANATFSEITGYSRQETLSQCNPILQSGYQSPELYAEMWSKLHAQSHWSGELWDKRKNGDLFAAQMTVSAVQSGDGSTQNYVALLTDITQTKSHQQQLEHVAHHDFLTGLPNRTLLADRLQQAIIQSARSKRLVAVAFLDLDDFKTINDLHGHEVGDGLLIALAKNMRLALRGADTLARIGGDEFVAILSDLIRVDDAKPVLERLLAAAAAPVNVSGIPLRVSGSIGIAIYPEHGTDSDQLLRHADRAMYKAKKSGCNRFYFFEKALD